VARQSRKMDVRLKRAYETPSADDGVRVLVDRLWPRGVRKTDAAIDFWMKDIAPSPDLRRWFGHKLARWDEFKRRYEAELAGKAEFLDRLRDIAKKSALTLVYAAKDEAHNHALVLRDILTDEGARLKAQVKPVQT
jgi:uncharacterized protein YeaO (DUF488 family)